MSLMKAVLNGSLLPLWCLQNPVPGYLKCHVALICWLYPMSNTCMFGRFEKKGYNRRVLWAAMGTYANGHGIFTPWQFSSHHWQCLVGEQWWLWQSCDASWFPPTSHMDHSRPIRSYAIRSQVDLAISSITKSDICTTSYRSPLRLMVNHAEWVPESPIEASQKTSDCQVIIRG